MRRPRAIVLKADGTNCEHETQHLLTLAGADAQIVPMNCLRWGETRLDGYDLLVIPGGFSYGDDVISGKILAVELISFLADQLADFAASGKPILGICNGFQVLVRTGLLPFGRLGEMRATLAQNLSGHYECRWVKLAVSGSSALLADLPPTIELPVGHGEGRFFAPDDVLDEIEAAGLVALRYLGSDGTPAAAYPANPNGALRAIAGLTDSTGRIFGLMPHPDRFFRSFHHPNWRRRPAAARPDGLALMCGVVAAA